MTSLWSPRCARGAVAWPRPRSCTRPARPPPRACRRSSTASCSSATRDLRRAALARRPVHRVHQAAQGHAQRLGEEASTSRSTAAPDHRRHEAAHPRGTSGAATAEFILFVQDQGGDENYNVYAVDPAAAPAAGADVPAGPQPHRRQGRARVHLRRAEERPRRDLRRPQRPRPGVARPLQGEHLDRRAARCCARTPSGSPAGCSTEGPAAAGRRASADERRHRGPARRRRRRSRRSTRATCSRPAARCGSTRTAQRVYMQSEQGRRRDLMRLTLFDAADGRRGRVVESDPQKRVDFGNAMFSDVTDELHRHGLRGRPARASTSRTRRSRPTTSSLQAQAARHASSASGRPTADEQRWIVVAASDVEPGETYLFDRDDEDADAAVPHPREAAARARWRR